MEDNFENLKIMVIDDQRSHLRLMKEMLESCGLSAVTVDSAEEAELILAKGRFHEPETAEPLDRQRYLSLWTKLLQIREREAEIHLFFQSLCGKTKLPSARRVLCFLADQEDVHLRLLDRLIGA